MFVLEMQDTYRHKGMRRRLVDKLRRKGIQDERILDAINRIPRHFFLDRAFEELAYEDQALPIGDDQTISQPYTVAYQTALLQIAPGDKVLEVGTGSGYQACVLHLLGARVYTIERQENLFHKTNRLLQKMGYTGIRTFFRDGYKGIAESAPFDKILVTAGAREVPQALLAQLRPGGVLVIPVGEGGVQRMLRIYRQAGGSFHTEQLDDFRFVPMLQGIVSRKS